MHIPLETPTPGYGWGLVFWNKTGEGLSGGVMANERAPEGSVFVCGACGKVSHWKYGFDLSEKNDASRGFDESCMLNSFLVREADITSPKDWKYPDRVKGLIEGENRD